MKRVRGVIQVLLLAFCGLAIFAGPGASADIVWLPFKGDKTMEPLQFPVNVLTPRQFSFRAVSSGVTVETIFAEKMEFKRVVPPAGRIFGEPGRPGLPGFTRLILVPPGARVCLTVKEGTARKLEGYRIYPVQPQPEDNEEFIPGPFLMDEEFYGAKDDVFYPDSLVSIRYDRVRGCPVAVLNVHTARYNPSGGKLLYYPDIDIDIRFEGGDDSYIPMEKRSIFLEDGYTRLFPNYEIVSMDIQDILDELTIDKRVDLLIITPDDLYPQASQLAEWKRDRGFVTLVKKLSDVSAAQNVMTEELTADNIRDYIKSLYGLSSMSYVLLFGDAEIIPPHYVTSYGTDLYYAEMDDEGYFPDLGIGRIPVNNADEAQAVVNKIIGYEQTPPQMPDFYERILHAAYFQDDDNDGTADRAFAQTVEEIHQFFEGAGYAHLPRVYQTYSFIEPQLWIDGSDVPEHLKKPDFPWDGDGVDIIDAVNEGSFLVVHRDHGAREGWCHPEFGVDNLGSLTNRNLLPVVLSINCQTGWFDNETDPASMETDPASESFAELLLTMAGGAVGVIAATRNSTSFPNNDLTKGFLDCASGATSCPLTPRRRTSTLPGSKGPTGWGMPLIMRSSTWPRDGTGSTTARGSL